jgi:hypothetical protein
MQLFTPLSNLSVAALGEALYEIWTEEIFDCSWFVGNCIGAFGRIGSGCGHYSMEL